MGPALKSTARQPSTNVPLLCTLCPIDPDTHVHPSFWKYSLFLHIKTSHTPHWNTATNQPQNLPETLAEKLQVTQFEVSAIIRSRNADEHTPMTPPLVRFPFVIQARTTSQVKKRSVEPATTIANMAREPRKKARKSAA